MKPVIAIPQMGHDFFRIYMKSKYVQSLCRAGARVRWISLEDAEAALAQLAQCDGLLMPGGADIEPALYGRERSEECGKPHLLRDEMEPKFLEAFLPKGKPVLCICRGVQMLNVFLGGTLHQHIPDHSDFKSRAKGCHPVRITPGSKLDSIIGAPLITVNSLHHQAVDTLGKDLAVNALSEDGIVEAVAHTGHPFCLGVQWHPEHMSRRCPRQQRIFDAFVNACKNNPNA